MKEIDGRSFIGNGQYIGLANNSRPHQKKQFDVAVMIHTTINSCVVLTETPIKVTISGILMKFIPDIVLFNNINDSHAFFIVEISEGSCMNDISKCKSIIKSSRFIKGAIVYDIQEDVIVYITKNENSEVIETNLSSIKDIFGPIRNHMAP